MAGVNKVILIGNVGSDPEIRDLPSGSKVANFSLATTETFNDKNGQRQSQTEWHRLELWEGLAKIAEQYIKKGDPLYIEGKIRNEKWTDKDGIEKSGVRIRVNSLQMLGGRNSSSNENETPNYGKDSSSKEAPNNSVNEDMTFPPDMGSPSEDDLPF